MSTDNRSIEEAKAQQQAAVPLHLQDLHCYTETNGVITTTMFDVPGYRVVRVLGAVYGITVRCRNWAAGFGMVIKSIAGGELKWFTNMVSYPTLSLVFSFRPGKITCWRGCAFRRKAADREWRAKQLYSARNDAISRIVAETQSRGGNAVICLRFDAGEISGGYAQVCAYGTAAIIEKVDDTAETHPQLLKK